MRYVLIVVGIYVAYATVAFLLQRRLMYPGTFMTPFREVRVDTVPGVEQLWLENGEGRSEAWLVRAATAENPAPDSKGDGPLPALLFFHGNGEFIDDWLEPYGRLAEHGLHVLLVEYPGYGRSTGSPTRASLMETALGAYDRLARREDVDPERIAVLGRSLGGGVGAELALRRPVAALVLQSTFTSVGALAARAYFLPPFLARDRFRPLDAIRSREGPTLVLHGRRDRIIPFSHGRKLAEASERASLVALECGHNDCPPSWDDYRERILGFLEEEGVIRSPRR